MTSNMDQSGLTWPRRARQILWPIARAVLIVYLLVVLMMMLFETRLVYPIPPVNASGWHPTSFKYEDVSFESADGTKLHGWFVAHPDPKRAILYCHGNGADVSSLGQFAT